MIQIFDAGQYGLSIYTSDASIYRHEGSICKPGLWRVVPSCSKGFWDFFCPKHRDAVIDDFGNLVAIEQ